MGLVSGAAIGLAQAAGAAGALVFMLLSGLVPARFTSPGVKPA